MKILVIVQRLIAIVTMIVGFMLMVSETPLNQGLYAQAWLTIGGFVIAVLSVGWLVLIGEEEELFIHETR